MTGSKHEISILQFWKLANEKGDDRRAAARNFLILSFLLVSRGSHFIGYAVTGFFNIFRRTAWIKTLRIRPLVLTQMFSRPLESFGLFAEGLCKWGYPFSSRAKRAEQCNVGVRFSFSRIFVDLFSLLCPRKIRMHSVRLGKDFDFDLLTPWDSVFCIFQSHLNLWRLSGATVDCLGAVVNSNETIYWTRCILSTTNLFLWSSLWSVRQKINLGS